MFGSILNLWRFVRRRRYYISLVAQHAALQAELAKALAVLEQLQDREQLVQGQHKREEESEREQKSIRAREMEYKERKTLILVPRLIEMLDDDEKFVIVDAGAREVDRDARWRPFPPERMAFIGFEPDKEEAARLNAAATAEGAGRHFVAAGLGKTSGVQQFEHNNIGGGSSFLRQNRKVTDRWKFENPHQAQDARDIFFPRRTEQVQVVSLADWAGSVQPLKIDFLKLNVQGAELDILTGAAASLDDVLGILVEVSFVESYCDRPMFVDIDSVLRQRGFTFFDLLAHHYIGRAESPIAAQHLTVADGRLGQLVSNWGQLIEGHALYLRDPIAGDGALDMQRILKLVALAEAFGQVEFAFELLNWLSTRADIAPTARAELRAVVASATDSYALFQRSGTEPQVSGRAAVAQGES